MRPHLAVWRECGRTRHCTVWPCPIAIGSCVQLINLLCWMIARGRQQCQGDVLRADMRTGGSAAAQLVGCRGRQPS